MKDFLCNCALIFMVLSIFLISISACVSESVVDTGKASVSTTEGVNGEPVTDASGDTSESLAVRLMDMTFAEIKAEYGELISKGYRWGSSPIYCIKDYPGVYLTYTATADDNSMLFSVYTDSADADIYPSLRVGMTADEVCALKPVFGDGYFDTAESGAFVLPATIAGSEIQIYFELPEDYVIEYPSDADSGEINSINEQHAKKLSEKPIGTVMLIELKNTTKTAE